MLVAGGFGKRFHCKANDRFGFSLHIFGRQLPQFEAAVERRTDIGTDQDTDAMLAGEALDTRGGIYDVADDGVFEIFPRADHARDHISAVDADAHI